MNMLQIHEQALNEGISAYHEFLAVFKEMEKAVYGFVEGKDDISYYQSIIENSLPDDWTVEIIVAGNKDKVVDLYNHFDWSRYSSNRIMFFLDRDLSEFINENLPDKSNVYVTDMYSIENNLVNAATCKRILTEICNIHVSRDKMAKIITIFNSQLEKFKKEMTCVMSWIIHWKRKRYKPCLNDICMKHIFSFSDGLLQVNRRPKQRKSIISYIHQQCNIAYAKAKIGNIKYEYMIKNGPDKFIRGKYLFWFLVDFCLSIHEALPRIFPEISNPPKMHVALSHSNAISILSSRARIPSTLSKFIKNTCLAYVAHANS